jgi:hypothetical protein
MKHTCEKCGEPLSKKEIREMEKAAEYSIPREICDDCFDLECESDRSQDYEQFSDADPGL